jgi:hypothetical protein
VTDVDARWQEVTCSECGKQYVCTPDQDYFHPDDFIGRKTLESGLCWDCFMEYHGMKPQPEPRYDAEPPV